MTLESVWPPPVGEGFSIGVPPIQLHRLPPAEDDRRTVSILVQFKSCSRDLVLLKVIITTILVRPHISTSLVCHKHDNVSLVISMPMHIIYVAFNEVTIHSLGINILISVLYSYLYRN